MFRGVPAGAPFFLPIAQLSKTVSKAMSKDMKSADLITLRSGSSGLCPNSDITRANLWPMFVEGQYRAAAKESAADSAETLHTVTAIHAM